MASVPVHVRPIDKRLALAVLAIWFLASVGFTWAARLGQLPAGWLSQGQIEAVGVATSLLFAWLEVRESVWNWPVAIVASVAYMWVFYQDGFFANMWLQLYYIVISVIGWYWWAKGGENRTELPIVRATAKMWVVFGIAVVLAVPVVSGLMLAIHHQAGVLDVVTAVLSIGGEVLLSRKVFENWWIWVTVNFLSVVMFLVPMVWVFKVDRNLTFGPVQNEPSLFTGGLYGFFFVLSISGLVVWRRALKDSRTA